MYFGQAKSSLILATGGLILYILLIIFGTWGIRILGTLFLLVLVGFFLIFLQLYFASINGDWENLVDMTAMGIKTEKVVIPTADEVCLSALFLTLKHHGSETHPTVLIHHGVTGRKENAYDIAAPLVVGGYNVLLVDARGHGETLQNYPTSRPDDWYITESTGIFPDLKHIIDYMVSRKEVDLKRIAMVGTSMGGGVAFSRGIHDKRIKLIVGLSSLWSWKVYQQSPHTQKIFSEPWIIKQYINLNVNKNKIMNIDKFISPKEFITQENAANFQDRIRMIHARNDQVLNYEDHFLPLQNLLKLPPEHVLVLEEGDHYLRGQEILVFVQIKRWLDEVFSGH
ncbi:MAG: alpha/beta hydrolase [Promethearchaeota archaeon]